MSTAVPASPERPRLRYGLAAEPHGPHDFVLHDTLGVGRPVVLSPLAIGQVVEQHGWGVPLRVTTLFPLVALGLIFLWLPETRGRELEEISKAASA